MRAISNPTVIFAEILQPLPEPLPIAGGLAVLSAIALLVIMRMISGIRRDGVQTRPDLLETTDMLVATVMMALYAIILVARFSAGEPQPAPVLEPGRLLSSIGNLLLFPSVVILMMIARNVKPVDVFGLAKVGILRASALGIGLGLLVLPLTAAVKMLTIHFTGSVEPPQLLVQSFSRAVSDGATQTLGLIALSAVVVAPLSEEILFRGYFYQVVGRWLGRVSAALLTAVFFGAVHDTWTDIPGLTVLALCFTVAYERTGSLVVPFVAHSCFNGLSLLALWYQVKSGITS